MFLKRIKVKSKEGKKRTYWTLVKSVRTATQTDESKRILLGRLGLKIPPRLGQPQWSSDSQM